MSHKNEEEKILIEHPKKLLLGVTNPYLASELAYHVAKYTSLNVLLIDADGLKPIISMCLGMKKTINDRIQTELGDELSAFNMAMEYISKTARPVPEVFKSISVQHPSNKNLFVLTGNDDIKRFEDYSNTTFELLLQNANESFDLVLVNVPYNIYDAFYLMTLDHAEYMIYGFPAYADDILSFNNLINFLIEYDRSSVSKHCYISFNYSSSRQMLVSEVRAVLRENFLGIVTGDRDRQHFRNEFNKCYARNMSKKNIKEYHKIAKIFGIQTKRKLFFKRS